MATKIKDNVLSFLQDKTDEYNSRIALGMRSKYGWSEFTYQGLSSMSKNIAGYLIYNLEVKKEEHVAILSESRIEFGAAFFASVIAGTTFIPLDIKLTEHELISIMSNCNPTTVFVSNNYLSTILKIKETITSIKNIILLDDTHERSNYVSIYNLPNDNPKPKFRQRSLNSTALIIYTSGTTGKPKGVQTTFKNILAQIKDIKIEMNRIFKDGKHINVMSILPMNHLFEFSASFSTFLSLGYSIYYAKSLRPKDVLSVMKDKQVSFMCTVPSFFKMLKMQFEADVAKKSKFKRFLYDIKFHYIAKFLPFMPLKKIMFRDIHMEFGNKFYGFLSGGAPLDLDMAKYFNRIGIKVHQGYGLSEASPVVTYGLRRGVDIKSVGTLLSSFEAKIDPETGELLVKGPAVMKGYYKQEELTREVIDEDGWLHTGDVARIDKKGQVYITGRIKNMIVLPGGKKVFPEEIESVMDESDLIKEACALSAKKQSGGKKGTEEVTIVVVPKDDLYEKYDDETVKKLLINEVKTLSQKLSQFKRPTNIIISKDELPKTATKKVKRKEVQQLVCSL
ncbi:MAG: AMP-binding protein [Candidatus Gastranaerophilales bacterium]|nr:AMP-binding protein [Candidatus Gastranaerophilales bacterium]